MTAPSDCRSCNAASRIKAVDGDGRNPKPGDLVICSECGALLRFNESLERVRIDEPPADADPEMLEALATARAYIKRRNASQSFREATPCPRCGYELDPTKAEGYDGRLPKPADFAQCPRCRALLVYGNDPRLIAADRDRSELEADAKAKGLDPDSLQQYERSAVMTRLVVKRYLADFPGTPPKFALGPDGIGILSRLSPLAGAICKDYGARVIVHVLELLSEQFQDCPEPTYTILRGVLTAEGIPFERVSLADLGIVEHDLRPS